MGSPATSFNTGDDTSAIDLASGNTTLDYTTKPKLTWETPTWRYIVVALLRNLTNAVLSLMTGITVTSSPPTSAAATSQNITAAAGFTPAPNFFNLQNLDTKPVYVKYGAGASSGSFSYILAADTVAGAGYGGQYRETIYKGVVSFATEGGTINVQVATG